MIEKLKRLLGLGPTIDFAAMVKQGAKIIDVRTKAEFQQGHIKGAENIPLNNLSNHYAKMKKDITIITCCASGVRSSQAKNILLANGYSKVFNGGGWMSLKKKLG